MAQRTFVPFEDLWAMAIDVPYSFLVKDGGHAWTCGQLALDQNSAVLCPGDLSGQSEIVCRNIKAILEKGGLPERSVARVVLYYMSDSQREADGMLSVFRSHFGSELLLEPIRVPHFYYDGVVLEVDVFAGADRQGTRCGELHYRSSDIDLQDLSQTIDALGASGQHFLSEHWLAPTPLLDQTAAALQSAGRTIHPGTIVDIGPEGRTIFLRTTELLDDGAPYTDRAVNEDGINLSLRTSGDWLWIQGSAADQTDDLVGQTRSIMDAIARNLDLHGFGFADVVKSTTHYVAGDSAEELHDNMQVRNSRYSKPGPASTGVPVFGFADRPKRIVVDLTARLRKD